MINATPLFSGSSGNCTHIECEGTEVLIDAGVSCLAVCNALNKIGSDIGNISAILVTHEHCDHIKGLEIISKKYAIPVYINSNSAKYISGIGQSPFLEGCMRIRNAGESVTIGKLCVDVFKTPHDSCGSVCYRMTDTSGFAFGFATDIGYITKSIANALLGCDSVVIESNHDISMLKNGPYPYSLKQRILSNSGHLSNDDCARFLPYLADNGASKIWLAHLSKENNRPEIAFQTGEASLENAGFDKVCSLEVAPVSIL